MRILYFIPRYDSALMGNRIHAEVIGVWREHGVEAEVVTLTSGLPGLVSEVQDGITIYRLPVSAGLSVKLANGALNTALHYPYLAGALLHYRRFIKQRRYDLVHIETAFPLGLIAALTPRTIQPPLAITLPGADIMSEPEYDYGYGRFRGVRALLPLVFRRAAVLRADSPQIRKLAIRLGAHPGRVTAIPYNITADSYPAHGTDLTQLRAQSRAALVTRHNLDPARPLVVSLNRLHPFKGFNYLVESLPGMRRAGLDPQILIVGPNRATAQFGDYANYLRQRAVQLGVADAITFVGAVEHAMTLTYLAGADAAVVASVAESFSRVTVEAAAAGTPVVVTRTTGVSDYVGQCGLVIEPRSPTAIAAALVQLLTDRELWERFSAAGPGTAAAFSSEAVALALLRLYRDHLQPATGRITVAL